MKSYKTIRIPEELYNWLKQINKSPSKAIQNFKDQNINKINLDNHFNRMKDIEFELEQLKKFVESIVQLNKLKATNPYSGEY